MGSSNHQVPVLGKFTSNQGVKTLIYASIFVGVISFIAGFQMDTSEHKNLVWQGYLTAFFYFVSLALGGLFFTSIQYVTNAGWSVSVRRVSEAFTSFLPVAVVLLIPFLVFGSHTLYEWFNVDYMKSDKLLKAKLPYLNETFFNIRTVAFFLLWLVFAKLIVGNSLKQDANGDHALTHKNVPLAIGFLVVFALSYSLFSVDFLMSLAPHWFSTIYGVYTFSGLFQSTIAMMVIWSVWLKRRGITTGFFNENHLHDLGKLMFAFTVFYAYIGFSQFMLIWYANLPETTFFFMDRATGSWMGVSLALLVFKFVVPFLLLLPRAAKRDEGHMVRVAVLLLIMQFVDLYWLIYPNFSKGAAPLPIWGIGIFFGFLGLFVWSVSRFFEKNNVVPIKDPRLHETLSHHI